MPWVKIDDHFDEHPKVALVGPLGVALQVAALCYSNRNLTDGFVPRSAARRLVDFDGLAYVSPTNDDGFGTGDDVTAKLVIEQMLVAGVWTEVTGGYQIHNYGKYQPTREQVEAEREQKRTAGHLGGLASAAAAAQARAAAAAKHPPKRKPSTRRGTRSSRTQAEAQAESKPVPVPEPLVGEGEGTGTRGGSGGNDSPSPTTAASPAGSSQAAADLAAEPQPPNNGQPPTDAQRAALRAALECKRQDADAEEVNQP
jgi:hypothetical protein